MYLNDIACRYLHACAMVARKIFTSIRQFHKRAFFFFLFWLVYINFYLYLDARSTHLFFKLFLLCLYVGIPCAVRRVRRHNYVIRPKRIRTFQRSGKPCNCSTLLQHSWHHLEINITIIFFLFSCRQVHVRGRYI